MTQTYTVQAACYVTQYYETSIDAASSSEALEKAIPLMGDGWKAWKDRGEHVHGVEGPYVLIERP